MSSYILIMCLVTAFPHINYVPSQCFASWVKMRSSVYNEVDRFTNKCHSTTIGTIGLPRLARSLLTLIGSCRIYSVFQIKAGRFRTRYRSCNRFAKETICSSSLALTKNSVINKTQTQNEAQTLYFNLLQTVLSL